MFKAIKSGKYDFPSPFWDDVEPGAKDMIGCLLILDTEKRYSAEQVKYQARKGRVVHRLARNQTPFPFSQVEVTLTEVLISRVREVTREEATRGYRCQD